MIFEKLNHPNKSEEDSVDLTLLIVELINHYKLILAATFGAVILSVWYIMVTPKVYQADALVQVEQKKANALLANISPLLSDGQPSISSETYILQSRMILGDTVDQRGLRYQVTPLPGGFFGQIKATLFGSKPTGNLSLQQLSLPFSEDIEAPPLLLTLTAAQKYRVEWNGVAFEGVVGESVSHQGIKILISKIEAPVGSQFEILVQSRPQAMEALSQQLTISSQGKDSGILLIALKGEDPPQMAATLNTLVDNYQRQNIDRQAAQDAKSLDFLESQLPLVRSQLDQAEDKLKAFRQKNESVDLNLEARSMLEQLTSLENQLNQLTMHEAELAQRFKKDHPAYQTLSEKRQTLQESKNRLTQSVNDMPAIQQEILSLSQNVESGRAIYMQLITRQQELNIARSSAIGNVRVIDPAQVQLKPIAPKKSLILVMAAMLGGIFGCGVVVVRLWFNRGIDSVEELEAQGIAVNATIPYSDWLARKGTTLGNQGILAIEQPGDLAVEALKGLRTSLHFMLQEGVNPVLAITGASQGSGKTFVAVNFARLLAQSGQRVLYIDADMRRGYAHQLFGLNSPEGLAEYLAGKITLAKAIRPYKDGDFDVITRGQCPADPCNLLMRPALAEMLSTISSRYDIIIIDTPPLLPVSDARLVCQHAGLVYLVARYGKDTVREIALCKQQIEASTEKYIGVLINGIKRKPGTRLIKGYDQHSYKYE